jgi:anti-sigma B factor antagonist
MPHPCEGNAVSGAGARLCVNLYPASSLAIRKMMVRGDLDLATVSELRASLEGALTDTTRELDLDVDGVGFCDVVALDYLLTVQARLAARGGRLVIRGRCRSLCRMVTVLGLADQIHLEPVRQGAGSGDGISGISGGDGLRGVDVSTSGGDGISGVSDGDSASASSGDGVGGIDVRSS